MRYFNPNSQETRKFKCRFTLLAVFLILACTVHSQAPQSSNSELIQAGALIIPMDNFHQGNATQTTFNLRAYGLVYRLLKRGIPVKWAIRSGKQKDDADFSASVTRIAESGTEGIADGNADFSGGPFIVPKDYDQSDVRDQILAFNAVLPAVTVYKSTSNFQADIRYTLTRQPAIAVGPDGGQFGSNVHQDLLNSAGIPDYESVEDVEINASSCYTIVTQAHSENDNFGSAYRTFVQSGGNLLLQCKSIDTFENNPLGHFQAWVPGLPNLDGFTVFGTNEGTAFDTPFTYNDGSMPFNQFIGELANQEGAVTEFGFAPNAVPVNDLQVSVENTGAGSGKFVATVSKLSSDTDGGYVFELGGHNYGLSNTNASSISRLNGQRMFLNAVFVPGRSRDCPSNAPQVEGFKWVIRAVDKDGGGETNPPGSLQPVLEPGDTLKWTIVYWNNGTSPVTDFQISDPIGQNLQYKTGTLTISGKSDGVEAAVNPNYGGTGLEPFDPANPKNLCNRITNAQGGRLLTDGAYLPVKGFIQITLETWILGGTSNETTLENQAKASGSGLPPDPDPSHPSNPSKDPSCSDNADASIVFPSIVMWEPPPPDSIIQPPDIEHFLPTRAAVRSTSAAVSIDGMVRDSNGRGIAKAVVSILGAGTAPRTTMTNAFGYFQFDDLRAGEVYVVSVSHKRYRFSDPARTITLNDSVSGLTFEAISPDVKRAAFRDNEMVGGY